MHEPDQRALKPSPEDSWFMPQYRLVNTGFLDNEPFDRWSATYVYITIVCSTITPIYKPHGQFRVSHNITLDLIDWFLDNNAWIAGEFYHGLSWGLPWIWQSRPHVEISIRKHAFGPCNSTWPKPKSFSSDTIEHPIHIKLPCNGFCALDIVTMLAIFSRLSWQHQPETPGALLRARLSAVLGWLRSLLTSQWLFQKGPRGERNVKLELSYVGNSIVHTLIPKA